MPLNTLYPGPFRDAGTHPLSTLRLRAVHHLTSSLLHAIMNLTVTLLFVILRAMGIAAILPYVQIVLSILLMVAILLQRTGASLGGAFGADNFSSGFHTRRGLEKTLFRATIVLAVLFALSALIHLFTA